MSHSETQIIMLYHVCIMFNSTGISQEKCILLLVVVNIYLDELHSVFAATSQMHTSIFWILLYVFFICRFQTRSRSRNAWTHSPEVRACLFEICASCRIICVTSEAAKRMVWKVILTPIHHGDRFPLVITLFGWMSTSHTSHFDNCKQQWKKKYYLTSWRQILVIIF